MIAYKATYNFKCFNQEYKVGKTYTSDRMKICRYGFHFCQKMDNVLNYYSPSSDFILLEVEILGKVETRGDKSVTDKLKVLRVIPFDEYTDSMKSQFSVYEYDERGNLISEIHPDGFKTTYEYDERNNNIATTFPSGNKITYEYDDKGNEIAVTSSSGCQYTYKYDERNNMISKTNSNGKMFIYEYDDIGNKIAVIFPSGEKVTYEYDERNNKISETHPNGEKLTFEYAVITEE